MTTHAQTIRELVADLHDAIENEDPLGIAGAEEAIFELVEKQDQRAGRLFLEAERLYRLLNTPDLLNDPDTFLEYVQRMSVSRGNRWHGGDFREWSGLEWAGAMCGEAGEAANVAKKLRRVELARHGNAASERPLVAAELVEKLARECADVLLYLVLLAARYDIHLSTAVVETFNKKSVEMGFPERLELGRIGKAASDG